MTILCFLENKKVFIQGINFNKRKVNLNKKKLFFYKKINTWTNVF